jgi:uncharacterized protein (TIGR03083 family)
MPMTAVRYSDALTSEAESLRAMVHNATEARLGLSSACSGWSLLDVARHVEVTPRTVAGYMLAHFRDEPMPHIEPLPPTAGRAEVLAGLTSGSRQLRACLDQLRDEHLDGQLPGPLGLMPGRASLDLALTELTLHRCDLALGLGRQREIEAENAHAILDVLCTWLVLTAPAAPIPDGTLCYRISAGSRVWTLGFDGDRWSTEECNGEPLTVGARCADPGTLVLALAGRLPMEDALEESSDPMSISLFKAYLPGP